MAAGKANLYIEQGATFKRTITVTNSDGTPKDLTGYTFAGQIRELPSSSSALVAFTFSLGGVDNNVITASLTDTQTSALSVNLNANSPRALTRRYYDMEWTAGNGDKTRFLEGAADISPEVTR